MYLEYKVLTLKKNFKKMILEEQIKTVIFEQIGNTNNKEYISRNIDFLKKGNRIFVITGVRRCGKSTLLKTSIGNSDSCISINFEDPRLEGFSVNDFYKIEKIAEESGKNIFIFDEIQNIPEWEKYARAAHEAGKNVYITGSNASMLSKELGTRLTGRYKQIELFPFQYSEFLEYTGKKQGRESYEDYLLSGGFPEYLFEQNPEYLRTLLKDIIIRDIAVRRNIKNEHILVKLAVFLLSNTGKEFSYNNITKILQIKSVRSTIDYCDYLQESYLVEFVSRFSFSIKQQIGNPKKIYCIDTGMAKANSLSLLEDKGRMLENSVYLQLRTKYKDIQYYKDEVSECDFIIKDSENKHIAVQVCWKLTPNNLQREIDGLKNAVKAANAIKGIIISLNQEDLLDDFAVIPAWKWALEF